MVAALALFSQFPKVARVPELVLLLSLSLPESRACNQVFSALCGDIPGSMRADMGRVNGRIESH